MNFAEKGIVLFLKSCSPFKIKNLYKSEIYEYNLANRMKKSEVTDHIKKTQIISHYDYAKCFDALGSTEKVLEELEKNRK